MKKINWLGFVSLFSLFSIFGLVTGDKTYYSFLGFLAYLPYFWVIPDELFYRNVCRSASIGFFINVGLTLSLVPLAKLLPLSAPPQMLLSGAFALSFVAFTVVLVWLELREKMGASAK